MTKPPKTHVAVEKDELQRLRVGDAMVDDVLGWLRERGLYDPRDYETEGPDLPEILTEHENELLRGTPERLTEAEALSEFETWKRGGGGLAMQRDVPGRVAWLAAYRALGAIKPTISQEERDATEHYRDAAGGLI